MTTIRWMLMGVVLVGGVALLMGVRAYFNFIIRIAQVKSQLGWWDNRAGTIPRSRLDRTAPQHLSRRK